MVCPFPQKLLIFQWLPVLSGSNPELAHVSTQGVAGPPTPKKKKHPLKIALKRWDIDEGSAQFYRPVQENLVLVAFASSEGSSETAHSCSLARAFANHTKRKYKDEGLGQMS